MKLISILLCFGILASASADRSSRHRLSRGVFDGVDLKQVLAAVEPGYPLYTQQYVISPPTVQQYSLPQQQEPIQQQQYEQYVVNVPSQELSQFGSGKESFYNGPKPRTQEYSGPILRQGLNSVVVSAVQQSLQRVAAQQQYGVPSTTSQIPAQQQYGVPSTTSQIPDREYGFPTNSQAPQEQKEYGVPQANSQVQEKQYGISQSSAQALQIEYGVPQKEYGLPQKEYGLPQKEYGAPQVTASIPSNGSPNVQSSQQYGSSISASAIRSQPSHSVRLPVLNPEYGPPNNNQQYGGPAPARAVVLSQPQPAQSYGLPPATNQPAAYGAPSAGIRGAGVTSFNDILAGNDFGGGFDNSADISRDITIHVPQAETYEVPRPQLRNRTPKKPKKNYKIIFIKAPAPPPPQIPEIPEIEPEPEQKTLVYVLVQKPQPVAPIVIPTPAPARKSQPEVYYVKYRQAVTDESSATSAEENLERGSPIGLDGEQNFDNANTNTNNGGYNVPNQDFDLPRSEPTQAKSGY